ncbi:MAG: tryptophan-rich sensory protein [Clostridia bacterium]|nr:tryptophan-rich sensory protein [Clostridia bacterium]
MKKKIIDSVLLSVLLTAITAGVAMLFVDTKSQWYLSLNQPSFQPPGWVFGVVWTILYCLYAASLSLAQIKAVPEKTYISFLAQAVLNIGWCLFYFTLHLLFVGLGIIIAYLVCTYLTIRSVYPYSKTGALILLPQCLWLILAAVLNYTTILLN